MVGCRLNQAEIERLAETFRLKGYKITPDPKNADAIIVNTCCVTHKAAADSRAKFVRKNPNHTWVVNKGFCTTQRSLNDLGNLSNL